MEDEPGASADSCCAEVDIAFKEEILDMSIEVLVQPVSINASGEGD